jgi:hypothetical protein
MKLRRWPVIGSGLLSVLVFSCAGSGGGGGIGGTGGMRLALTDAPACGYEQVNVTVNKLRVHPSADAAATDAGWSDIVLSPPRRIDLLTLQNGRVELLGETPLNAGHYSQIRMVLADNSQAEPLANSVVPSGRAEAPLDTASSSTNGIKVKLDTDVGDGQVVDVVLDFDACKSVVSAGKSGHYKLKPVVTAIPLVAGSGQGVVGHVDPNLAMSQTRVAVQLNGVQVKATTPDASGKFVLYPVPLGRYDLVVTAAGRVTAVVTGVPVDGFAYTNVNTADSPIVPGVATLGSRTVGGMVSPPTATTRGWQQLTGGPAVEVGFGPVDARTGAYSLALPIDAPWTAAYAPTQASITFTADDQAAGQYALEAVSGSKVKTKPIDVREPVPPVNFTWP